MAPLIPVPFRSNILNRESFGQGDVIGCFLDMDKGVVGFSKNGTYLGEAFRLEGGANKKAYFPAVVLKQGRVSGLVFLQVYSRWIRQLNCFPLGSLR